MMQHETQSRLAAVVPDLKLLVLFGSRAKGRETHQSDWDLGILLKKNDRSPNEWFSLYHQLAEVLGINSDRVDLVNLQQCSPVLGYVIAREGQILYEAEPNLFLNFQLKAWKVYANTAWLRRYQQQYIQQGLERLSQW